MMLKAKVLLLLQILWLLFQDFSDGAETGLRSEDVVFIRRFDYPESALKFRMLSVTPKILQIAFKLSECPEFIRHEAKNEVVTFPNKASPPLYGLEPDQSYILDYVGGLLHYDITSHGQNKNTKNQDEGAPIEGIKFLMFKS